MGIAVILLCVMIIISTFAFDIIIKQVYERKLDRSDAFAYCMVILIIGMITALMWFGSITNSVPSAIDVYRGLTDIEIHTKCIGDSIVSCDTTVVWNR